MAQKPQPDATRDLTKRKTTRDSRRKELYLSGTSDLTKKTNTVLSDNPGCPIPFCGDSDRFWRGFHPLIMGRVSSYRVNVRGPHKTQKNVPRAFRDSCSRGSRLRGDPVVVQEDGPDGRRLRGHELRQAVQADVVDLVVLQVELLDLHLAVTG